jgi:ribosomal protein L7/L12
MNSHHLTAEAIDAIKRGEKVKAVAMTRESTGLGLKESKDLVEAYRDDMSSDFRSQDFALPELAIVSAIEHHQLLEAIKIARQFTGLDLKGSKVLVDMYRDGALAHGKPVSEAEKIQNLHATIRLVKAQHTDDFEQGLEPEQIKTGTRTPTIVKPSNPYSGMLRWVSIIAFLAIVITFALKHSAAW